MGYAQIILEIQDHTEEVTAKIMTMQDESMGQLMKEFDGLVTQGSSLMHGRIRPTKSVVVEIIASFSWR